MVKADDWFDNNKEWRRELNRRFCSKVQLLRPKMGEIEARFEGVVVGYWYGKKGVIKFKEE